MKFNRIIKSKKVAWGTIAVFIFLTLILFHPLNRLVFSARLGLSLKSLASGATGDDLAVQETTIYESKGSTEYAALLYSPEQSSITGAAVLIPGMSELGCHHPRLVAFSRYLADAGFVVITPDIREFKNFQITAAPIDQILLWHKRAETLIKNQTGKKPGLAGVSYSGTLALMAAAKPEIRDRVGFVAAIGPYYDLIRCTRKWFGASTGALGEEYYHARFYAKWIVMLAALEMLPENRDRVHLKDLLHKLLLQEEMPPVDDGLSPEGLRWRRLATLPPDQSDPELAHKIEEYLVARIYPPLNPAGSMQDIRCPVYLIHGAYDNLIPSEESMALHRSIPHSRLLISPFLTHTHPNTIPLSGKQKFQAIWDVLTFCGQFSRVAR
jgi:pimeloyl-ACP methyl ester carboxylesterase